MVFLAIYTANLAAFMVSWETKLESEIYVKAPWINHLISIPRKTKSFKITREEYLEFSGIGGKIWFLLASSSDLLSNVLRSSPIHSHWISPDARLAYPYYRHPPLKFGTITGGNTHAVLSANKPNLYSYMRRFNRLSAEDGKSLSALDIKRN